MRIVIVSDTHGRHASLGRLQGDVLIHCGDMFNLDGDQRGGIAAMDRWFGLQEFDLILCTGGNHDVALESVPRDRVQPFENAVYLEDCGYSYKGKVFWGAPWTPILSGQAFYMPDKELEKKWSAIPQGVDVLITHTPPKTLLDSSSLGLELGCGALLGAVRRVAPAVHCFGHVHHSRGQVLSGGTHFINASSVQRGSTGVLPPIEIEI